MNETKWQRTEEWIGAQVEDSFVMINLESGTYVSLNRTASAVWEALETPQSQSEIEAALAQRFDIDADRCATAVTSLLTKMSDLKLAATV